MRKDTDLPPLPERDIKRLRLWVWIVVVLGIASLFAGLDRFYEQHNPDPTNAHIRSTALRNVTVHDVGFRIPKPYFHPMSIPSNGSSQLSILLNVELPDIAPQTLSSSEYLRMEGPHKAARVLVDSPIGQEGISLLTLAQRIVTFSEQHKTTEQGPSQHGLTYLRRPAHVHMDRDEIFYEGDQDDPLTVLFCGELPGHVPYPSCKLQFYYEGLIVRVSFRRADWLPQWREIKQNTVTRLDEFHSAYLQHQQESTHLEKGI